MRRDDLRRSFLSPDGVRDIWPVSDAEALDAIGRKAALRHWLTEECALGVTDNDRGEWVHRDDCPYCESRGRVPRDGVTVTESKYGAAINVPLDWLGDDQ